MDGDGELQILKVSQVIIEGRNFGSALFCASNLEPIFFLELRPKTGHDGAALANDLFLIVSNQSAFKDLKQAIGYDVTDRKAIGIEQMVERLRRQSSRTHQIAPEIDSGQIRFCARFNAAQIIAS